MPTFCVQTVLSSQRDDLLEQQLQEVSQRLLADEEPRVRLAAGECLGLLAKLRGLSVWADCRRALLDSIHQDYVSQKILHHLSIASGNEKSVEIVASPS